MNNTTLSYKEAIKYLYSLQKFGIKFGLSKTSNLMKAFGNPHQGQKYIHIGGTNGKGSVAAMVESVLIQAGLKVGFYSSPHLVQFTERFRVNGKQLAQEKIARVVEELKEVIDPDHFPTFFEVTTAMALILFAREKTDLAIMEVGMGGRLDATNIIKPSVCVITNISMEHQAFLGNRLVDIAAEKAGIIKEGVPLVTGATQSSVIEVFKSRCEEKHAPFWRVGKDVRYRSTSSNFNYYGFRLSLKDVQLGLKGRFQRRNAALAAAAIELVAEKGFEITPGNILEGLKNTRWPGRMQVISEKPLIVLDGGHNPAAISELVDSIPHSFNYKRLILVLGVMGDKDIRGIVGKIVPLADYVIFTKPDYYRSASPERVMGAAAAFGQRGEIQPDIPQALDKARAIADSDDMILVCGSLFMVGETLTILDPDKYPAEDI